MFFLIRSAFWLAIVFSCMSWPGGERPADVVRQAAGDVAAKAQTAVLEKAASSCAGAPADCLVAMQRAGTIVQRTSLAKRLVQSKSPD